MHGFFFTCNFVSSSDMSDFSLVKHAGLLQSFSVLKPRPFLTIDSKLPFKSASIQSTSDDLNKLPSSYFFSLGYMSHNG